jgi:Domain of unknown function (DUF4177)
MAYLFKGGTTMRWEYKTIRIKAKGFLGGKIDEAQLDDMMNDLGRDGWELAAALDTTKYQGATQDVVVIFKKPI